LTKPLAVNKVQTRLISTLKVKQVLFNINNAIERKSFSKALYFAESFILKRLGYIFKRK
jgi:hypothetical protein